MDFKTVIQIRPNWIRNEVLMRMHWSNKHRYRFSTKHCLLNSNIYDEIKSQPTYTNHYNYHIIRWEITIRMREQSHN